MKKDVLRDKVINFDWDHSSLQECKDWFKSTFVPNYIMKGQQDIHTHDVDLKRKKVDVCNFAWDACRSGEWKLKKHGYG